MSVTGRKTVIMRKKIMTALVNLLHLEPSRTHHEYVVFKWLGTTGKGKVWQDCQGYLNQVI